MNQERHNILKLNFNYVIDMLDIINGGDARRITVQWVSSRKARILRDDQTIFVITAGDLYHLDDLVYLFLSEHCQELKALIPCS